MYVWNPQKKGGEEEVVHCSKMQFTKETVGEGWCATKLDDQGENLSNMGNAVLILEEISIQPIHSNHPSHLRKTSEQKKNL